MSIFKNNLNFIFDTLLNSRFLSFWKFNRYLPSIEILTDTISLNSLYLFFSKVLKFAESFCKKLVFATNKDNDSQISISQGMETIKGLHFIEPLTENSKFAEKADNSQRFNRFYNSLLNYDYKTGNYVGY